ncbi:sigma-54 dependent transcriptional regulator [Planktomarina sp.]|nr:sigma-54 dependent transcriptional regulator [Planktomarina sp.]
MSRIDEKIIGGSEAANNLKQMISLVAPSDSAVIINGPTGAGKELVAEALHDESRRKGKFIAVNCAAIPKDLMEAELFGYEKGAFTGAVKTTHGKFEQANAGTLFLDEIGDMSLDLQSKLLRILENSCVTRVGGHKETKVNVRVVCATHKDLGNLVSNNEFRDDLFFRLNVFPIQVPSLSDRLDDIPLLIDHLLKNSKSHHSNNSKTSFSKSGLAALKKYDWPGNIRELRNIIERAAVFYPGQEIDNEKVSKSLLNINASYVLDRQEEADNLWESLDDLGGAVRGTTDQTPPPPSPSDFATMFEFKNSVDLRRLLQDIEIVLIESAMRRNGGNTSEASRDLKLQRTTLIEKIKKLGL